MNDYSVTDHQRRAATDSSDRTLTIATTTCVVLLCMLLGLGNP